MRTPEQLLESGLEVIDRAFAHAPTVEKVGRLLPLYSGGYDSVCACYVASQHRKWKGDVFHIDTGIGSCATRKHVEESCSELGWVLKVLVSTSTYEQFVRKMGFPGPGGHQWVYVRIKERCIRQLVRGRLHAVLVTGCRSGESTRRMGHVEPIKVGETSKKTGTVTNKNRMWIAPCHDWTDEEQRSFVSYHGFLRNPVKDSILGMSGECFCGAFARPNEREMIRQVCPDVDAEITRLEKIAAECGIEERNSKWGYRDKSKGRKPIEVAETGPLCNNCDRKSAAAGIVVKPCGGTS